MANELLGLQLLLYGLCGIGILWVYVLHTAPSLDPQGLVVQILWEEESPSPSPDAHLTVASPFPFDVSCHALRDINPPRIAASRPDLYEWEKEESTYLHRFIQSRGQRPTPVRRKRLTDPRRINILLYTNHFHTTWSSFAGPILRQLSQTCGPSAGFNFTCGISHQTTSDSSLAHHEAQAYYADTDILLFVGVDLSIADQIRLNHTVWTTSDRPAVALLTLESSHNSRANAYFRPSPPGHPHPLQYTDILVTYSQDAPHSVPINYFYGLVEDCPGMRSGSVAMRARAMRYPIATCISPYIAHQTPSNPDEVVSALFISNCVQWRLQLLRDMHELGMRFDSYGSCLPEWRPAAGGHFVGKSMADKIAISSQYKFVFAIENNLATDYVTEKFFQPFLIPTSLPVYIGAFNAHRYAPAPHSFIDFSDFPSLEAFVDYIYEVNHNDTLYRSYFHWRTPAALQRLVKEERRAADDPKLTFPNQCVEERPSTLSPWFALAKENFIRDDASSLFCRLCRYGGGNPHTPPLTN